MTLPTNINKEPPQTIYTQQAIDQLSSDFTLWLLDDSHVWFKDFFLERGISPSYMAIWAKSNERWKHLQDIAKDLQESRLVNNGLTGGYKSDIVKLVLANKHGWRTDKSSTEISVEGGDALTNLLKQIEDKGNTIDVTPE